VARWPDDESRDVGLTPVILTVTVTHPETHDNVILHGNTSIAYKLGTEGLFPNKFAETLKLFYTLGRKI
jgi:hypothetical protein